MLLRLRFSRSTLGFSSIFSPFKFLTSYDSKSALLTIYSRRTSSLCKAAQFHISFFINSVTSVAKMVVELNDEKKKLSKQFSVN